MKLQWDSSIVATIGERNFVLYREVALSQGLICTRIPLSGYFQGLYISRMGKNFNFTNGCCRPYLSNTCEVFHFMN